MPLADTAAKLPGYKGPYFGSLVHDFREYIRARDSEEWLKQPPIRGRIKEIEYRISQIHWILIKIYRLQVSERIVTMSMNDAVTASLSGRIINDEFNAVAAKFGETIEELNFLVEAFYYFSWQLILALEDIPDFKGFRPRGITIMRNKVLTHPADYVKTETLGRSYRTDEPDAGPILKMGVSTEEGWRDPGLIINAHELFDSIKDILSRHAQKVVTNHEARIKAGSPPS